jgi:AcrR family transcriptional regulator
MIDGWFATVKDKARMKRGARERARLRSGERRYDDIVVLAGELFAEKGFAGTSLQDIAEAVGVLKGSLYHYIDSKEDLLFDVIKVAHQGLIENMRLADHYASDPVSQLAAFAYGHVALNAVPDRIHRGIVFMRDLRFLPEDKRKIITDDRDAYDAYLRSIVRRGQAMEVFDNVDTRLCSFSIFGVLTSYIRWYHPGGSISLHEVARHSAYFILRAVLRSREEAEWLAVLDTVASDLRSVERASAT